MTRLTADWLAAPEAAVVFDLLEGAGFQAWFVGGCVRNTIIGTSVSDLDIATDAWPEQVLTLCKETGVKAIATGAEHGTVTVIVNDMPFEVTTFRKDIDTDGRRAVVEFARSMTEDAHRRDFTMNALYAGRDGKIVDPLGGLPDLLAGRVRFIDDPEQRIREDYLRILRFFRFHAWYGDPSGGIDAEGLAACAANIEGLARLSRERVGAEVRKLLGAPNPAPAVSAMAAAGVLGAILPGAVATALGVMVHLEQEAAMAPNPVCRLAALGGEGVPERLRLSNAEAGLLAQLRQAATETSGPAELGYRLGKDRAALALLLRAALTGSALSPEALKGAADGATRVFPLKAADLMPALEGVALGRALKEKEAAWIASGFALGKAELLEQP